MELKSTMYSDLNQTMEFKVTRVYAYALETYSYTGIEFCSFVCVAFSANFSCFYLQSFECSKNQTAPRQALFMVAL